MPNLSKQHVGQHLAVHRVAHMDRHDVRAVVGDRQAKALEAHLEDAGVELLAVTQRLIGFQVRTLAAAPAATAGGSEVVKMKPGA
jgi:hypothetical protein